MGKFPLGLSVRLSVFGALSCVFADAALAAIATQPRETPDGIFLTLDDDDLDALPKRAAQQNGFVRPLTYRALLLDDYLLHKALNSAPLEEPDHPMKSDHSDSIIWLPMPDGTDVPFSFVESPIMEPELADQYPEIRTYLGNALDGSNRYVRFDRTPQGFHALIRGGGDVYIGPGEKEGAYLSYRASDYPSDGNEFTCGVEDGSARAETISGAKISFGGMLRTFRLAVACTGEYANFHGATSDDDIVNVLAAITTMQNFVDAIFEGNLGVRFVLVGQVGQLIFTDPATDPFAGNLDTSVLIDESQAHIQATIGDANYDIGHTYATAPGGRAAVGVACNSNQKARGCSGSPSPTADPIFISVVCHELGHQLGATHTFNSTAGGCGNGSRNGPTAFERGSGSTIMSYFGSCGVDNLQGVIDNNNFHSASLEQISGFLTTNTCSANASSNNSPPTVSAGPDFTIPKGTPFTLTAQGSDPDGDLVSYAWEERDKGPKQALTDPDNGKSPLFRCFLPTINNERTFPELANIISGANTLEELLPSLSRTMKFVIVARDLTGGFATDETRLTVASAAGPFRVTFPNGAETFEGGVKRNIRWNVAGTDAAPIDAADVKILFSEDGGHSFPTILKSSTPNDGKQKVTIPDVETAGGRIKIEAIGNVFFDISDEDFTVGPGIFDIVGTWVVDSTLIYKFFADGSMDICVTYDPENCSSYPYEWIQTGPDSGELTTVYTGSGHLNVHIVNNDLLELSYPPAGPVFATLTRI
ncbi:MAG: hypothetical protein HUU46_07050 [Candidatus Hydrogenedentes bacterium]|nr:hypothetical protein [Candidatus Hydrogenedentota bacterium]